jgi:hypothetical protein
MIFSPLEHSLLVDVDANLADKTLAPGSLVKEREIEALGSSGTFFVVRGPIVRPDR